MKKLALAMLFVSTASVAADLVVPMHLVDEKGVGVSVGKVTITESKYGLVLTPAMQGLKPGVHGFHVHQSRVC